MKVYERATAFILVMLALSFSIGIASLAHLSYRIGPLPEPVYGWEEPVYEVTVPWHLVEDFEPALILHSIQTTYPEYIAYKHEIRRNAICRAKMGWYQLTRTQKKNTMCVALGVDLGCELF